MIDSERLAITQLNLAHAHLTVDALVNGVDAKKIPSLTDFVPEIHTEPEVSESLTFDDWARALLPLGGVVPPSGG